MRRALLIAALWTLAGTLLAAQAYVSESLRGRPIALTRCLAIWLSFAYLWALLTPVVFALTKRFPLGRAHVFRGLLAHTVGASVIVTTQLALYAVVAPLVGATSAAGTWMMTFRRLLGSAFLLDLPVYVAIVAAAEMIRLTRTARERERQLTEARLLTLKSQLQPHFLFNTLNTISVLMHEDVDDAERVLGKLSNLLRRSLDVTAQHVIPLRDEIGFLESYLEIESARFADRLSYRIDVEPAVLDASVPSFILQPLVENAIRHGIARRAGAGHIEIAAARVDGNVCMSVRDDGPGVATNASDGVGLTNTRARLEQLYGRDHRFQLASAAGITTASLAIPLRAAEPR